MRLSYGQRISLPAQFACDWVKSGADVVRYSTAIVRDVQKSQDLAH